MTIHSECVSCIINQSRRVSDAIGADEALSNRLVSFVEQSLEHPDFTLSPPIIATPLYEAMAKIAKTDDLYGAQKNHATEQAKHYLPYLQSEIDAAEDTLLALFKTAVVGNVIDLAAEVSFDLHGAIHSVFDTPFAHDDTRNVAKELQKAKTLLYIGDNAGEHIFDQLAIRHLKALYPHIRVYYMVRGRPIINDVTMTEALEAKMEEECILIDSGVPTPGFVYELATLEAQQLFDTADLIIAKGMGNYECLTPERRSNICYLLKVKCSVVSRAIGHEIGSIICKLV